MLSVVCLEKLTRLDETKFGVGTAVKFRVIELLPRKVSLALEAAGFVYGCVPPD